MMAIGAWSDARDEPDAAPSIGLQDLRRKDPVISPVAARHDMTQTACQRARPAMRMLQLDHKTSRQGITGDEVKRQRGGERKELLLSSIGLQAARRMLEEGSKRVDVSSDERYDTGY